MSLSADVALLGSPKSRWPVAAWIRLRLPHREAPLVLMGSAPPPVPPLELLEPNPVPTDPRRRIFAHEEERPGGWVLRLVWDSEDPEVLEAEYRAPVYGARLAPTMVTEFWTAVRARTAPLGPLSVEAADPRA